MIYTGFSGHPQIFWHGGMKTTGSFPHTVVMAVYNFYFSHLHHGPLDRYAKLRVAHAPGMPGTFSPPPRVSDPDMHHGTCVTHVPWCMPGSLTSGFLRSRWRGKRSRHSRRMRNPQFCTSGKRPIGQSHCTERVRLMHFGLLYALRDNHGRYWLNLSYFCRWHSHSGSL